MFGRKETISPTVRGAQGIDALGACGDTDREMFARQFRASFPTFWLIAVGIVRNSADAEDVVQEAAIIALEKLDRFQRGTNFKAWMGRIVRYVALNQARREKKHRTSTDNIGDVEDPTSRSVNRDWTGTGSRPVPIFDRNILEALDTVNEVARACLLLRTIEGMAYADIAELLEIPEGTAMSHVHRARRGLRDRLATYGQLDQ